MLAFAGLPLLAGNRGGVIWFTTAPAAGFLWGWLAGAALIGALTARLLPRYPLWLGILPTAVGGMLLIYAIGIPVLAHNGRLSLRAATAANAWFLAGDSVKVVITAVIAKQVHRAYPGLIPTRRSMAGTARQAVRSRSDRCTIGTAIRVVLDGIDLTLTEHRIGIVGANGSGKSTLARMINGLAIDQRSADRRRPGHRPAGQTGAAEGRVSVHRPGQPGHHADGGRGHRLLAAQIGLSKSEIDARVRESLRQFGLDSHADHPTHLLSVGQKQLLALAAVVIRRPEVLVADEPTTLLDLRNSRLVADLLASLPQQVVVVTHHLHLLTGFDRALLIDAGRVVADGSPAETAARYQSLLQ